MTEGGSTAHGRPTAVEHEKRYKTCGFLYFPEFVSGKNTAEPTKDEEDDSAKNLIKPMVFFTFLGRKVAGDFSRPWPFRRRFQDPRPQKTL